MGIIGNKICKYDNKEDNGNITQAATDDCSKPSKYKIKQGILIEQKIQSRVISFL